MPLLILKGNMPKNTGKHFLEAGCSDPQRTPTNVPNPICSCCGKLSSEIDAYWWKYVQLPEYSWDDCLS